MRVGRYRPMKRWNMAVLDREFEFYQKNKESILSKYENRFVVILNDQIIGIYDDRIEAIDETIKTHELGTFLVQHAVRGDDEAFFHSRVFFKNAQSA